MRWLEPFGLSRKPLPGLRPERHGAAWWSARALLLAVLVGVTVLAFPRSRSVDQTYAAGDAWRGEAVVAPYTFAVLKDPARLRAEQAAVRAEVEPFVRPVDSIDARVQARSDSLSAQLNAFGALLRSWARATQADDRDRALRDSVAASRLRAASLVQASADEWAALGRVWTGPDSASAPVRTGAWLDAAEAVAVSVSARGVVDVVRDSLRSPVLVVRDTRTRTDRLVSTSDVLGLHEARQAAERMVRQQMGTTSDGSLAVAALARSLLRPSYVMMRAETNAEVQRRLRLLPTTLGEVRAGEVVVERGQRLTPELIRTLESLDLVRSGVENGPGLRRTVAGQAVLALCTFLLFFLYLYLLRRQIFDSVRHMSAIALVMAAVILLFGVAVRRVELEMLAVPVALAAALFTVVYDSRVGIFATVTLALVGGHLLRYDLGYTFATLFACTLVAFSVRDLRNRGQFFLSAALLFAAYAVVLYGGFLVGHQSEERFRQDLVQVGLHSLLLLLVYPLLWAFERLFGVATELTLMELAHPGRSLLKELLERAPGTYSHSLQVASLADACATAIGADALLVRVGALYHDIGKMRQPEFFVENQQPGDNPHDALTPHMSALIIAGHVRHGIEIAREHRLPDTVVRFIARHHGTTRIEYFYRKALAEATGEAVVEADYRYPGPRPDSKETAILMLCDGCEAASRSLDDPTPERLEDLVDKIVEARRADGQLDRADLTFDDLRRVRETIVRMLVGHHHGRVKYPGPAGTDEPGEASGDASPSAPVDPVTTLEAASDAPPPTPSEKVP